MPVICYLSNSNIHSNITTTCAQHVRSRLLQFLLWSSRLRAEPDKFDAHAPSEEFSYYRSDNLQRSDGTLWTPQRGLLQSSMARSKARVYIWCALLLFCVLVIIVCLAVFVRRKCPAGTFSRAAVAADSRTCSEIGRWVSFLLCTWIICSAQWVYARFTYNKHSQTLHFFKNNLTYKFKTWLDKLKFIYFCFILFFLWSQ